VSRHSELTPTSYAVLGLLGIQPWTTYELAQQMDRTLSRFWPRARSKLYEEPKKLVAHGLARSSKGAVGQRPRTVYTITAKGRRALAAGVAEPAAGPVLEFEQLLKVFFAENGSTDDLRRTLAESRTWAHERTLVNIEVGRSYLEGRGAFPERAAVNMLVGRFLDDVLETVDRWAQWATEVVSTWPDDPREARADEMALAMMVRTAADRSARWLALTGGQE
jgi:PadR family transcriptional regulator, regulatory protein AphA